MARFERYTPDNYSTLAEDIHGEPATSMLEWEESKPIAKVVYECWGFCAREQFERGIIEQPRRFPNWLICSGLRRIYGDISDIEGFDKHGNFICNKANDILVPVKDNGRIVRLRPYSSRALKAQANANLPNSKVKPE